MSIANLFIKSALNLTDFEYDSLDGIYFFFLCVKSLFTGYLADSRGRLFAISVSLLCYIFGMLVVSIAQACLVFFVGLALAGVGVGVCLAANTMYFTEIVPKDIRGQFVALEEVSILLGLACGYASGWFFYCLQYEWSWNEGWNFACWRAVGFCSIITPLVVLILLNTGFVLESPRYLMMVGLEDEGKEEASVALADWSDEEESSATWWQVIWDRTPSQRSLTAVTVWILVTAGRTHRSSMVRWFVFLAPTHFRIPGSWEVTWQMALRTRCRNRVLCHRVWCQQVGPSSIMLQRAQTRKPSEFLCFFLLVLGFGLPVVVFCGLVAGALSAWFRVFFPACAVCGPFFPFCLPFG